MEIGLFSVTICGARATQAMGKRSHPPLTPNEVIEILIALGFAKRGQEGSHAQYLRLGTNKRKTALVTVDVHYKEFDSDLIHKMIRQSGFGRKEFSEPQNSPPRGLAYHSSRQVAYFPCNFSLRGR